MHGVEKELGVTNVSITDSSLEDVFIAVVLKYDKVADEAEEEDEIKLVTLYEEPIKPKAAQQPARRQEP